MSQHNYKKNSELLCGRALARRNGLNVRFARLSRRFNFYDLDVGNIGGE